MRPAAAILVLLTFLLGSATLAAGDFIGVRGKRFVTADGRPFAIRGINLGNWLVPEGYMFKLPTANAPRKLYAATERLLGADDSAAFWRTFRDRYITPDDIRFIASLGFTVVRVPITHRLFMSEGPPPAFAPVFAGEGWARLDDLVDWCRDAGLRVVIDLHAAPGGQTGFGHDDGSGYPLLFYVARHRAATVALWRAIAERYADEPTVLGYDLLNEPIAPHHDTVLLNPRLEPLYRRIVAAIREVDEHHIVVLAAAQWSSSFRMLGPPFDGRAAYTYHKFWSAPQRATIAPYIDFANRHDVVMWVGETGEFTDAWNRAFRDLNERHGIGWAFWSYKNLDTPSAVVSVRRPDFWDKVIEAVAEPASGGAQAADDAVLRRALADYLDNLDLARCRINRGYIDSLGLTPP
ncbi:MAG: glycoside hydrolase family 5 protein [Rhodospirillales bacterium]|jgi:hypothetical protein|nr:glycoside hydrolase family 5 protein [Rhodospirillales bacterium]